MASTGEVRDFMYLGVAYLADDDGMLHVVQFFTDYEW